MSKTTFVLRSAMAFKNFGEINRILNCEALNLHKFLNAKHNSLHKFDFFKSSNKCFGLLKKYFAAFGHIRADKMNVPKKEADTASLDPENLRLLRCCLVILAKMRIMSATAMKHLKHWVYLGHLAKYCSFLICTISTLYNLILQATSTIESIVSKPQNINRGLLVDGKILHGRHYVAPSKDLPESIITDQKSVEDEVLETNLDFENQPIVSSDVIVPNCDVELKSKKPKKKERRSAKSIADEFDLGELIC